MPKERDPIWKHVQRQENGKWKCSYCGIERGGGATRIWAHLAGFGGKGIKGCEKVDHQVRKQALQVIKGKRSTLDESTGGTSGQGTEGIVCGASQSVLPSDDVSNPNDTQNSNRPGCALQQPSCDSLTGTGSASACPQDQVSLPPPSDMPLDNLDNTQQSDPSNRRLDAAHGNENAPSLQPLSSLYISEPPAHPELSTHLLFGTGTPPACPQYEVSLPREDKSMGGTSGEGTEGTDTQNSNQLGCAPQQPSFYLTTGSGTASARPQDQGSLPPGDRPVDNLVNIQQSNLSNHRLSASHGNEIASPLQKLPMDSLASLSLNVAEVAAFPELSEGGQQSSRGLSSVPNDQFLGNSMSNWLPEFIGGDVLITTLLSNMTTTSIPPYSNEQYSRFDEQFPDEIILDSPLHSTENPHCSLPENPLESRDIIVNTSEEIQTNELHNPTVGSSLQNDSSLDVDSANRLQDCGQPCVAEGTPVRSNTSPTDTAQHPDQLPPRCGKEGGNDIRQFSSRTPMDVDPSTASQQTCVVDSLVPEAATNTMGPSSSHASGAPQRQIVPHRSINLQTAHENPTVPSSSCENHLVRGHPQALVDPCMPSSSQAPNNAPPAPQILPCGTSLISPSSLPGLDMNEGVPMMIHPNTGNNFEENRDLKRKLQLIYEKEAGIRFELEYAAPLYLKKLRMEVANWLADVEKLRNDRTEAASEGCLRQHQRVDTLMHEAEDLTRLDKGLFEARESKVGQLLEDKMVGEAFQINTTKILKFLVGNQISQLGIYGMGGVGKTTIMVHIYNRLLEVANYGNVLWITVSLDFNKERLQDAIWKELGSLIPQENDVRKRAAILHGCLMKSGKSTIILDDVWECFDLKEVGIPVGVDGIKLVLTTRSSEVCCHMRCQEMIKIEPLSQKEAQSLFLEELRPEVVLNLEIERVVKSIVEECAGLPLAVITMAASMRGVTNVFEWKDCLEKLRESDMGQLEMEKEVLKKLEFSYNRLNHEIQQCFLSCALYPEDKLIDKFELIELFIDQGLIGLLNTREKLYNRGLTILNKLENVCLLEDHGKKMKMHDLIRDMALNIMSTTSIVKARKGLKTIPSEEYWTDALEKVSLMENDIEEFPLNMSPNCPKLSTFLLNRSLWFDVVIPNSFFKHLQGLKVLNLSYCRARELPDSISNLANLRALLLRYCHVLHCVPYLGKLRSLRKLDIFSCRKVKVLEGLEKLVDLRYLDVGHTKIKQLPRGTLGALLNLQCLKGTTMNGEDITKLKALDLETLSCSFKDLDEFNKLVRMVSEQRNKPPYYKIEVGPRGPNICANATYDAQLENCERRVSIDSWSHAIVSIGGESSGSGICILIPQNVQTLRAEKCNGVTNLSDIGLLENLEELEIERCKNLRVLSGRQDEEIINIHDSPTPTPAPLFFQSLRDLDIHKCKRLRYLFGREPKFCLPHLRKITITSCKEMVGITEVVTSLSPHLPPALPRLENICVWRCNKLKRVVESKWLPHFFNLRTIEVVFCENVEEIIEGPFPYMLVEEISLEKFKILGCNNLRKLFPRELLIHLRNLQSIEVKWCKGMVEMISEAGQGQEGSIMTSINNTPSSFQSSISLPKLISLHLYDLRQLKSICEVPITCDSMRKLVVLKCPELNRILWQLRIHDIEDLPYIRLQSEELWKTLTWDHPNAQAILQSHRDFGWAGCVLKDSSESVSEDDLQWSDSESDSESESEDGQSGS